jgi:hypothetical protein
MNMQNSGSCTVFRVASPQPTLQFNCKWGSVRVRSFGDPPLPAAGKTLDASPLGPGYYDLGTTICSPNPFTLTPHLRTGGYTFGKPGHVSGKSKFHMLSA